MPFQICSGYCFRLDAAGTTSGIRARCSRRRRRIGDCAELAAVAGNRLCRPGSVRRNPAYETVVIRHCLWAFRLGKVRMVPLLDHVLTRSDP